MEAGFEPDPMSASTSGAFIPPSLPSSSKSAKKTEEEEEKEEMMNTNSLQTEVGSSEEVQSSQPKAEVEEEPNMEDEF